MKTVFRSLLFFAILSLFACGGDDLNAVTGTWKLTALECNDGVTTTTIPDQNYMITANYTFMAKDINTTLELNKDGTYTSSGSYTQVLSTTIDGSTTVQEIPVNDFFGSGVWELEEDQIIFITSQNQENQMAFFTIEGDVLNMEYLLSTSTTMASGGLVGTITQDATIFCTLERD